MPDFSIIDNALEEFREAKHGIFISKKASDDWFVFQYRSIKWKVGHFEILIEVLPELDESGNSTSWNLSMIIYYDDQYRRYYFKEVLLKYVSLNAIEKELLKILKAKYELYNSVGPGIHNFEFVELKKNP